MKRLPEPPPGWIWISSCSIISQGFCLLLQDSARTVELPSISMRSLWWSNLSGYAARLHYDVPKIYHSIFDASPSAQHRPRRLETLRLHGCVLTYIGSRRLFLLFFHWNIVIRYARYISASITSLLLSALT